MPDTPDTVSVESAIQRGLWRVTYPSMALLFVPLVGGVGFALLEGESSLPGWAWAVGITGAFGSSWLWWSVMLPRWRTWAIERTDDLGELLLAALAKQLMWAPGSFFEKTEIRPRHLQLRLQRALRVALARYAASHPDDEPSLREFVDPWLYPGRRVRQPHGARTGSFVALLLGVAFLAIVGSGTVTHFLYDSPVSWTGTAVVTGVGAMLTMLGLRAGARNTTIAMGVFLILVGLRLGGAVLRSYPWRGAEAVVLVVALVAGGVGYFSLRRLGSH